MSFPLLYEIALPKELEGAGRTKPDVFWEASSTSAKRYWGSASRREPTSQPPAATSSMISLSISRSACPRGRLQPIPMNIAPQAGRSASGVLSGGQGSIVQSR